MAEELSTFRQTFAEFLGTTVLRCVAGRPDSQVLYGQTMRSRQAKVQHVPWFEFYGSEPMVGGLPGHRHPWPELAVVLSGKLLVGIGKTLYQPRPGDWLAFASGVLHGESYRDKRWSYRLLWFVLNEQHLSMHTTAYERGRGFRVLRSTRFALAHSLQQEFMNLSNSTWTLAHGRPALLRLIGSCLTQLENPTRAPADLRNPLVEQVQQRLQRAIADPPSVVELANLVGLSPNYLSSLFHRQTGVKLRRYIENLRIEESCRRMRNSALSIKQIAYALGFADVYHFSHVFKRVQGISPAKWRQQAT